MGSRGSSSVHIDIQVQNYLKLKRYIVIYPVRNNAPLEFLTGFTAS
jgi:hypothetical protein